jgi:hypothetical protein
MPPPCLDACPVRLQFEFQIGRTSVFFRQSAYDTAEKFCTRVTFLSAVSVTSVYDGGSPVDHSRLYCPHSHRVSHMPGQGPSHRPSPSAASPLPLPARAHHRVSDPVPCVAGQAARRAHASLQRRPEDPG